MSNPIHPNENDAVLGGQAPSPYQGAILGGLAGVQQRFSTGIQDQQIAAVRQAVQYGDAGLNLLRQADESGTKLLLQLLQQKKSRPLRWTAYQALSHRTELPVKTAVSQYNPYRSFQLLFTLEGRTRNHAFSISPDSQYLLYPSDNTRLNVCELNTGRLANSFQADRDETRVCSATTFSPEGENCIVAFLDHRIEIRNFRTGQTIETLYGQADHPQRLAISSDGQLLIVGSKGNGVEVWNLVSKRSQQWIDRVLHIRFVGFSADEQQIISLAGDAIRIWQRNTGELLHTLHWVGGMTYHCNAVYMTPDQETVIAAAMKSTYQNNRSIFYRWNLRTGEREYLSLEKPEYIQNSFGAAFSPDGQTAINTYHSGTIKLWNWQTGELLRSLQGHNSTHIPSVLFSPNGQFAVTGGNDGTIQIWGLPAEDEA